MNNIKLSVQTNDDRTMVIVGAETLSGDSKEERSYFIDPVTCVSVANAMLHASEDCGVTVEVQRTGISDERRFRLYKRAELIMRSLGNRKLDYAAAQVVDTILSEVM
jgi:hypothetical protein